VSCIVINRHNTVHTQSRIAGRNLTEYTDLSHYSVKQNLFVFIRVTSALICGEKRSFGSLNSECLKFSNIPEFEAGNIIKGTLQLLTIKGYRKKFTRKYFCSLNQVAAFGCTIFKPEGDMGMDKGLPI